LEKELKSINGIKEIRSNSIQDFSLIVIEFETNIDNDQAYLDVKEAVDKAKPDLPTNLLDDPEVTNIDLSEFPILYINLSGDLGLVKIKDLADDLKDEIEGLAEITRVDIVGALDKEYQINVDLYKMQAAGISFTQIENVVAFENMTISSGQIESDGIERTMRIVGQFQSVEDIRDIMIMDGVYLKDIADVKEGYADRESYSRLAGEDVITLNVIKKSGQNLIIAVDKIKEILKDFETKSPQNLVITTTGDQSTMTRNNVSNLFNTIVLGFMIVVLVLMFFMGIDNALFVAVSIPLSMLIAFIMIPIVGFTMNMVVLVSFILVLGIVVDNSIVVVENIYRHFMTTENLAVAPAAKKGTAEVAGPILSGTLTTMAPFIPLAFWPGIFGKFMLYIPVTLIITLTASMLVAYLMNPVFAVSFMKYREGQVVEKSKRNRQNAIISIIGIAIAMLFYIAGWFGLANLVVFFLLLYIFTKYIVMSMIKRFQKQFIPRMMNAYKRTIRFVLKGYRSYAIIVGTLVLLIFTFFLMGVKPPKVVLFSDSDPNTIHTFIVMPDGTDIEVTDSITKIVETRVFDVLGKDNPDVESVISNVAINAGEDIFERSTQSKLGKVTINFVEYQYRTGENTSSYLDKLRDKLHGISGAKITVSKENMGPPTGKPINIEISGEKFEELIPIMERVKKHIDSLKIPGIEELKSDIVVNKPEVILNIDRAKANKYGISSAYVGAELRTALYGKEISKFKEEEEEYDIRLRLQEKYRENIDMLLDMKIVVPGGNNGDMRKIPISAIADAHITSSYGGILRKDHKRVITISSNVLSGYNANEIVQKIKKSFEGFDIKSGY
ncbi:efflux RND transporter permease subunit, partial [candidate division KSB1 bacterium]